MIYKSQLSFRNKLLAKGHIPGINDGAYIWVVTKYSR